MGVSAGLKGGTEAAGPSPDSPGWLQIREEIDKFGIHVYQFPECDSDEDEDFKQQDRELKVSLHRVGGPQRPLYSGSRRVLGPWSDLGRGSGRGGRETFIQAVES